MGKKRKSQSHSEVEDIVNNKTKEKKIKRIDDKNTESNEDADASISAISQPVMKNDIASNSSKPKKIIFVDDQPQEVPIAESKKKNKRQKIDRSQNESQESNTDVIREEDVKDEDIDRFCDELDEEDNKQYEDWVRLIEANFSSNKKKPK